MRAPEAQNRHQGAIHDIAESYRVRKVRVFGSVMRGADREGSDLDFLVDPNEQTTLFFDKGAIRHELRELLGN